MKTAQQLYGRKISPFKSLFSMFCLIFLVPLLLKAQGPDIKINGKSISITQNGKTLVQIDSIAFDFVSQSAQNILFQRADSMSVQMQYKQASGTANVILNITVKGNTIHLYTAPTFARHLTVYLADQSEHFFGLQETLYPENRRSPDLRGEVMNIEINAEIARYYENCASVWSAFYFTTHGYASFMNTFAKGEYRLGINGKTSLYHSTGALDWYIFSGDAQSIYTAYYSVIGKPKFVPLWAAGPVVWRDNNQGGAPEILDDAKRFSDLKIPLTSLMVDRPYSNGAQSWSKMDFGPKFSNPGQWIKELKDKYGLEFLTWIAPATFTDKDFPALLQGYYGYMDLSNPQAVNELGKRIKQNQYTLGIKGHKMDRGDEYFPVAERWFDGTPEAQRRNKYVWLYSKITDSLLRSSWGDDHFNFARTAYQGTQRYLSALWGGDVRSTWDGMASNQANAVRASFMGFPNWGSDVGGYQGAAKIPDDLYIRWLQWGVFNGFYEIKFDGSGGDRAPWNSSEQVQKAFRLACEQRMEWLPYIFSQLNTSATNGPLMKPLAMVYPNDPATYSIWDEYLFGNSLLVAPVFSPEGRKNVYLPEGEWIDFYSSESYQGNRKLEINTTLDRIPLYIKANTLHVRGNIFNGSQKLWSTETQHADIYYYGSSQIAESTTFDFVDPGRNNNVVTIRANKNANNTDILIPAISYPGKLKVFSRLKPAGLTVNGKSSKYTYSGTFIELPFTADKEQKVSIRYSPSQ